MRLPSVQQILQSAVHTFRRFPFVLINALLGTIAAVILADHEGPAQPTVLFNILLATILGIPLLTALALFTERKKWKKGRNLVLQEAGIVLLAAYGCSVPSDLGEAPGIYILRLFVNAVALHLAVAFAPFTGREEINGFWQFNKSLFLRLITTIIYTVVLYAGLALALAALDNLFGINVSGKRYAELWFILLGLFNTWSFLAGIPENLHQLEGSTDYPKGIKVFAQYILLPLVLVYLVILYAYLAKILISWSWPQGWVSRLILGFATTGIFSFLLLHPVSNQDENSWIKTASRWFYVGMIPLVIMLLLALWRRISEYGMTEGRYIAVALGIWLAGIVLYFVLSKTKSIKVIPISLSISALLISFGPWGVFQVSEKSQVDRLQGFLTRNQILVEGIVQKAPAPVPQEDSQQISSILSYLHDIHGFDRIQPWFRQSLKADSLGGRLQPKDPALLAGMMGIDYLNVWYGSGGNEIWLGSDQGVIIDLQGYHRMIRGQYFNFDEDKKVFTDQELSYRVNSDLDTITLAITSAGTAVDSLQIDLHPLVNQLLVDYRNLNVNNIPPERMMLNSENQQLKVKIYFRHIRLHKEDDITKTMEFGADILYQIKEH